MTALNERLSSRGLLEYEALFTTLELADDQSIFLGVIGVGSIELGDLLAADIMQNWLANWQMQNLTEPDITKTLDEIIKSHQATVLCLHQFPEQYWTQIASDLYVQRDRISRNKLHLIIILHQNLLQQIRIKAYDFISIASHVAEVEDLSLIRNKLIGEIDTSSAIWQEYQEALADLNSYEKEDQRIPSISIRKLIYAGEKSEPILPHESIQFYEKALAIAQQLKNPVSRLYDIAYGLGFAYNWIAHFQESNYYYELALTKANDLNQKLRVKGGLLSNYLFLFDFEAAKRLVVEIETNLATDAESIDNKLNVFRGLSAYYRAIGNLKQARAEIEKMKLERKDSFKVEDSLSRYFELRGQLPESIYYIHAAIQTVRKLGYQTSICNYYRILSSLYISIGEFQEAKKYCNAAIDLSKKLSIKYLSMLAEIQLSKIAIEQGENDLINHELETSLSTHALDKDPSLRILAILAFSYNQQMAYASALEKTEQMAKTDGYNKVIFHKIPFLHEKAYALLHLQQLDEARGLINEADQAIQASEVYLYRPNNLNLLGLYHQFQSEYPEAITQHKLALEYARESGLKREEIDALHYLGNAYQASAMPEEALKYWHDGLSLAKNHGYQILATRIQEAMSR